jgi:hypothetical protein
MKVKNDPISDGQTYPNDFLLPWLILSYIIEKSVYLLIRFIVVKMFSICLDRLSVYVCYIN